MVRVSRPQPRTVESNPPQTTNSVCAVEHVLICRRANALPHGASSSSYQLGTIDERSRQPGDMAGHPSVVGDTQALGCS